MSICAKDSSTPVKKLNPTRGRGKVTSGGSNTTRSSSLDRTSNLSCKVSSGSAGGGAGAGGGGGSAGATSNSTTGGETVKSTFIVNIGWASQVDILYFGKLELTLFLGLPRGNQIRKPEQYIMIT